MPIQELPSLPMAENGIRVTYETVQTSEMRRVSASQNWQDDWREMAYDGWVKDWERHDQQQMMKTESLSQ